MIPSMLLFGLVIGRFWAVPLGAIAWAAIVVVAAGSGADIALAALLGAANAIVGVAARKVVIRSLGTARAGRNG
jgi:hypothetical protein